MPFFGKRSLLNLSEALWTMQKISQRAISKRDHSIIDCARSNSEQNAFFAKGVSKARAGESPHKEIRSQAYDILPAPFPWNDWECAEAILAFKGVKNAYVEALAELKAEGEVPESFELEYGFDWGWDHGHIQNKNWRNY